MAGMTPRNSPFSPFSGNAGPEIPRATYKGRGKNGESFRGPFGEGFDLSDDLVLIATINRCCRLRGDAEHHRADLITECLRLEPAQRADLTAHFQAEADRWALAVGEQA